MSFSSASPTVVIKRDGRPVPFDSTRIRRAIALAFAAHDAPDVENPHRHDASQVWGAPEERWADIDAVADVVIGRYEEARERGDQPTVEALGDWTEEAIAGAGHWEVARSYVIYRTKHAETRSRPVTANGLQEYIAISKYARWREDLGRRELFEESVDRVRDMHLERFAEQLSLRFDLNGIVQEFGLDAQQTAALQRLTTLGDAIQDSFADVRAKRALPSMRALQFGGEAIKASHSRQYNCSFTFINRPRVFGEIMYLLLCGTGVGFSVQRHHVDQLPPLPLRGREDDLVVQHWTIADTIEGWADAVIALIDSYYKGVKLEFNYALIRPRGTPLKTSGGRAPGHLPLKRTLTQLERILDGASGRKLKPIEAYDMVMFIARAVLSGGIRRSATIALFSPDDEEMASAKTGDWFSTNPQRAGSNNSALLVRREASEAEFNNLFQKQIEFGEPGFYFSDSTEYGTNPCVPGDTWVRTEDGLRQVRDLIGRPFAAMVDGQAYQTTSPGFVQTGVKPLVSLALTDGRTLRLTANHEVRVMTRAGRKWQAQWKAAGELQVGERIALHQHEALRWGNQKEEAFEQGQLLGWLLGDGNIQADGTANLDFWGEERHAMQRLAADAVRRVVGVSAQGEALGFGLGDTPLHDRCRISSRGLGRLAASYGLVQGRKEVTGSILREGSRFQEGFLRGWFDADGTVGGTREKGFTVRLTSVDLASLRHAQYLLDGLGIPSTLYEERRPAGERLMPDGRGGSAMYDCQATHELVVSGGRDLRLFQERVGFSAPSKALRLQDAVASVTRAKRRAPGTVVRAIDQLPAEPVYDCTVETVHAFDANGCYVSNCAEIGLAPYVKLQEADIERLEALGHPPTLSVGEVVYGVQFCNLTTINGGACVTAEDFLRACVTAATIGTIQASYVHIPYLGPVTQFLNEREALLGVSITGIMDNPQLLLEPTLLEQGARMCKAVNAAVAQLLGISRAARITCIKPEGTASLLLNTGSGIHPHHAKRYFRRVQVNRLEPPYQHFVFYNPHMTEPSVYNPQTDDVLTFPVEAPPNAILRKDLSAMQFLRYVKLVQKHWVLAGSNVDRYNPGLHHNVSNTVTFTPEEADEVRSFIWENRHYFTGISLLQALGDKVYAQAPREEVTTPADIEKWNRLVYEPVDWTLMMEAGDQTSLKDIIACAGGACEISF